ncbi:MAG: hypothetical protein ACLQKK_19100, partial [Rhodomicrobium sp.]
MDESEAEFYGFSGRKAEAHGAGHVTMAIYSFNHDSFGKTTNRAGAAGPRTQVNGYLTIACCVIPSGFLIREPSRWTISALNPAFAAC